MSTLRESLTAAIAAMSNGQWILPESRDIACECIAEHGPALLAALDDAERYQWLRNPGNPLDVIGGDALYSGAELDAAIDAARKP